MVKAEPRPLIDEHIKENGYVPEILHFATLRSEWHGREGIKIVGPIKNDETNPILHTPDDGIWFSRMPLANIIEIAKIGFVPRGTQNP